MVFFGSPPGYIKRFSLVLRTNKILKGGNMTEGERRSEISRRAWLTRGARRAVRRRISDVRSFSRNRREAWITEWFERHRPELEREDEETLDNASVSLEVMWRFAGEMGWLRDNIESLHEDEEITNSLLEALHVIWHYTSGISIPARVIKTTYEPCIPLIRRKMQL
jgi:hypothetical protein